jgi:hypothetical protein
MDWMHEALIVKSRCVTWNGNEFQNTGFYGAERYDPFGTIPGLLQGLNEALEEVSGAEGVQ